MKHIDSTGRAARVLLLALAALGLPACYDFPVPLDPEPMLKPDSRLLGVWACLPAEPTVPPDLRLPASELDLLMTVKFQENDRRYRIRMVALGKPDEEEGLWDGYASELDQRTVLNLWPISKGSKKDEVTLVTYRLLSSGVVQFDLIDDDPVKGKPLSPSSELRKTLLAHRPQDELFSPFMVCVRAKVGGSS